MARRNKRASMREGPLSDLFRSTADDAPADPPEMDAPGAPRERDEEAAPRYGREDPAEAKKAAADAAPAEPPRPRPSRPAPRPPSRSPSEPPPAPPPVPSSRPSRAFPGLLRPGLRVDARREQRVRPRAAETGLLRGAACRASSARTTCRARRATGARSRPTSRPGRASRTSR